MTARPLRETAKEAILEQLLSSEIEPGARIREVQLAETLGISRTPLREALFELERAGFVHFEHNRGFSAALLSPEEVRQVYPMLSALEVLALKLQGLSAVTLVAELNRVNALMGKSTASAKKALSYDSQWHETLVKDCGNALLLETIRTLRRTAERYEQLYMHKPQLIKLSVKQHAQVAAALGAYDIAAACMALETNWSFGMSSLLSELGKD